MTGSLVSASPRTLMSRMIQQAPGSRCWGTILEWSLPILTCYHAQCAFSPGSVLIAHSTYVCTLDITVVTAAADISTPDHRTCTWTPDNATAITAGTSALYTIVAIGIKSQTIMILPLLLPQAYVTHGTWNYRCSHYVHTQITGEITNIDVSVNLTWNQEGLGTTPGYG